MSNGTGFEEMGSQAGEPLWACSFPCQRQSHMGETARLAQEAPCQGDTQRRLRERTVGENDLVPPPGAVMSLAWQCLQFRGLFQRAVDGGGWECEDARGAWAGNGGRHGRAGPRAPHLALALELCDCGRAHNCSKPVFSAARWAPSAHPCC